MQFVIWSQIFIFEQSVSCSAREGHSTTLCRAVRKTGIYGIFLSQILTKVKSISELWTIYIVVSYLQAHRRRHDGEEEIGMNRIDTIFFSWLSSPTQGFREIWKHFVGRYVTLFITNFISSCMQYGKTVNKQEAMHVSWQIYPQITTISK